jgi:hypothetical protein
MKGARWGRIGWPFRRAALPLAAYYAVTLALPVAHGASWSAAFRDHALVVLLVPPVLIVLWSMVGAAVQGVYNVPVRRIRAWRSS